MTGPPIVLASASPRRRVLLADAGVAFDARASEVDETVAGSPEPEAVARELALRKARSVAELYAGEERWVLGADTVVALPGPSGARLLGKPSDAEAARAMLAALSGTTHAVVTGVAVVRASDGRAESSFERTRVTMRPLRAEEIDAYVASGEWRDKAGGYAIQETADAFVTRLEGGGFDNVVGLPVALALELLGRLGAPCP